MENTEIALITGASRGLGFATGVELARRGAHVIAVARTVGGLEDLADAVAAVGGSTTLVPLDITDDAGLQRMCHAINDRWGRIDIWVHSAIHAPPLAPAEAIGPKDLDRSLAINVRAAQRLIVMIAPLLPATGRVVHVTDDVAGRKFHGTYGATKAAQTALFQSWAAERAAIGPRITGFAPVAMPTALRARFMPGEDRSRLTPVEDEARRLVAAMT